MHRGYTVGPIRRLNARGLRIPSIRDSNLSAEPGRDGPEIPPTLDWCAAPGMRRHLAASRRITANARFRPRIRHLALIAGSEFCAHGWLMRHGLAMVHCVEFSGSLHWDEVIRGHRRPLTSPRSTARPPWPTATMRRPVAHSHSAPASPRSRFSGTSHATNFATRGTR